MGRRRKAPMMARRTTNQRRNLKKKSKINRNGQLLTKHAMLDLDWDKKGTLKQNYAKFGIQADVNADIASIAASEKAHLFDMDDFRDHMFTKEDPQPTSGALTEQLRSIQSIEIEPHQQTTMALWEQIELKKLMQRYGDDVESMSRDIKLNKMQKTAKQLRKRLFIYKRLLSL